MNDLLCNPDFADYVGRLPKASEGDAVTLYFGWGAFGKGRTQSIRNIMAESVEIYRNPVGTEFSLTGEPWLSWDPQEAEANWWDPISSGKNPSLSFNGKVHAPLSWAWWTFDLPSPLLPGDYSVHWRQEIKHPTFDLYLPREGKSGPYKFMPGDPFWSGDRYLWFTVE